ncbi:Nucleolar protein 4 [Triplophysa tibetana]|uniref:Nucleolar protein 4 n=1 Tax=Triplophysa tibetana TaxID=1572043 RepID=A0A5A9NZA2_9TELE|nr:Nucleolar protein 4 [Triplophysa tibetana]
MATKKPCTDLTKRSRSPVVLEAEMFSEFQDWCLRTYGDSGKTKTVTRRKYNKIMQTLLQNEESDGVYVDNSHINAKFKFWVKSKGFQVGSNILGEHNKKETSGKTVLYVPVKTTGTVFSAGPCVCVCVCECDPAASFLMPPPFSCPVCVRLFTVMCVRARLPEGVGGSGVAACRISPSSLLATELFGAGRCSDGGGTQDSSLKRVAVVEDFFDIIYAMHVEMGADPGRAPKHAGQKKTYKAGNVHLLSSASALESPAVRSHITSIPHRLALPVWQFGSMAFWEIAETYAFLPREAVTRFLMSCGECQKRMHINPSTAEFKENDRPTSLVPDLIDYNMPLTATYLKQMKLQCMTTNEQSILSSLTSSSLTPPPSHIQDESSVSSEDLDMAEPAWVSTERAPAAEPSSPAAPYTERMPTPPQANIKEEEDKCRGAEVANGAGGGDVMFLKWLLGRSRVLWVVEREEAAWIAFFVDDSSSENGSTANGLPALTPPGSAAMATGGVPASEGAVPYGEVNGNGAAAPLDFSNTSSSSSSQEGQQPVNLSDRLLPGVTLGSFPPDLNRKFPVKTEYGSKMFVRLFVDENLDRMVPISKQPKEKIQAIIESCSRQFPEFQERARKRIRTYLKSCRRMKKVGFETRPTPPHLTSAMAENILAAACESETRNAAKRMRLDIYQAHDETVSSDKSSSRDPAALANSGFTLAASAYSQDQLYTNGGLNYSFRGYGTLGNSLQNNGTQQTNGPTDLSMKSLASNSTSSSSSNSHGQGGGGGGASAQLSPPEVTAVRQLIAGYRESAAFLLRSADELENLILQQN